MVELKIKNEFSNSLQFEKIRPFGLKISAPRSAQSPRRSISSLPLEVLTSLLHEHRLLVLRGFESMDRDSYLHYARDQLAQSLKMTTLDWEFGPVMEMKERENPKNYLFSSEMVPFHWDGAFHHVPYFLLFYCVQAPTSGSGGETLFCNTQSIWERASQTEREVWQKIHLTYETAKLAHYGGRFSGPLVQPYPRTSEKSEMNIPILRFAEAVKTNLNPVTLQIDGIPESQKEQFLINITEKIYSPDHCYRHTWRNDDIIIADNHALIHGRRAFSKSCPRHLRRIQLI